ncbi:MAG: adenylosuccinate lyase [Lentimicrobiaceae bacterium]|nr:adenylosuccinate lyase [Lentimicrobiaceae bacterium]
MQARSTLTAISPLDGRYRSSCEPLAACFSEAAIIRYRIQVEVSYLLALSDLPLPGRRAFAPEEISRLNALWQDFQPEHAVRVKDIEKEINHDVKAIEYFIREAMEGDSLQDWLEFVHFGLTSQDINNTAFPMALRDAWTRVLLPVLQDFTSQLKAQAVAWSGIPMLARTHGQPASPTLLGKEIYVFVERIEKQLEQLDQFRFSGKFGGATGNFNAHHVAYPEIDWPGFADRFMQEYLQLDRQQTTTQIEHYDGLATFFHGLSRICIILMDYAKDIWTYVSMDYFQQKVNAGEVGSSAMPHKVNPIDFENAEGNLGLAHALLTHLAAKLPVSRLQRDLTDSTVIRNIGVPLGHLLISVNSLIKGMNKLRVHPEKMLAELDDNWAVLAEAIQTILRREGIRDPYKMLKDLTRTGNRIDEEVIRQFIESLPVSEETRKELRSLRPSEYTGVHPWIQNKAD